jgi:ABC-type uncharacterized transport system auxiliary subunit
MIRYWIFLGLTLIALTGCSSLLLPTSPPPGYYRLEYQTVGVECAKSFTGGLRVWDFTTSSPFDQRDMVVIDHEQKVSFSGSYEWIAPPGTMLAESLLRDLDEGSLFPQVVSGDSPIDVPLALTGHVFTFAWVRQGSTARAVLQVEVSLSSTGATNRLIFHRNYELTSEPFTEDTAAAFAGAMSGIVSQFSQQLQGDLCFLGEGSGSSIDKIPLIE